MSVFTANHDRNHCNSAPLEQDLMFADNSNKWRRNLRWILVHLFVLNNHNYKSQRLIIDTATILYWNIKFFTQYWYQNRNQEAPSIINTSNQYWPITKFISLQFITRLSFNPLEMSLIWFVKLLCWSNDFTLKNSENTLEYFVI